MANQPNILYLFADVIYTLNYTIGGATRNSYQCLFVRNQALIVIPNVKDDTVNIAFKKIEYSSYSSLIDIDFSGTPKAFFVTICFSSECQYSHMHTTGGVGLSIQR